MHSLGEKRKLGIATRKVSSAVREAVLHRAVMTAEEKEAPRNLIQGLFPLNNKKTDCIIAIIHNCKYIFLDMRKVLFSQGFQPSPQYNDE